MDLKAAGGRTIINEEDEIIYEIENGRCPIKFDVGEIIKMFRFTNKNLVYTLNNRGYDDFFCHKLRIINVNGEEELFSIFGKQIDLFVKKDSSGNEKYFITVRSNNNI